MLWCLAVRRVPVLLLSSGPLGGSWWSLPLRSCAVGKWLAVVEIPSFAGVAGAVFGALASCGLRVCVRVGHRWLVNGCGLLAVPCFGSFWVVGCGAAGGGVSVCSGVLVVVWLDMLMLLLLLFCGVGVGLSSLSSGWGSCLSACCCRSEQSGSCSCGCVSLSTLAWGLVLSLVTSRRLCWICDCGLLPLVGAWYFALPGPVPCRRHWRGLWRSTCVGVQ